MLLAFNGSTTQKAKLDTDIEAAAAAGFKALEIWVAKLDQYLLDWWHVPAAEQLRETFAQHNIRPISVNAVEGINFRGDQFDLVKRRCRLLAETMKVLGCPYLVVAPGMAPRGTRGDEARKETVKALRALADTVTPYGVSLAFEPQGFHWSSVRTLGAAWDIVQEVNRDEVGLVLDAVHFHLSDSPLSDIERLDPAKVFLLQLDDVESMDKDLVGDVHRVMPGNGVVPLGDILRKLKVIGYDGICSLELNRPALWERDPVEVAREGYNAMQRVLRPHFQTE